MILLRIILTIIFSACVIGGGVVGYKTEPDKRSKVPAAFLLAFGGSTVGMFFCGIIYVIWTTV